MVEGSKCSHSELITRVVALEAGLTAFKELLNERDERYKLRANAQDAAVKSALETSEKAITKADDATEKRFQGVNEFRQTLSDQAATLMPRAEYTVQHAALGDKVAATESRINAMQQDISAILARGGGLKDAWGYLVGFVGIIVAIAAVYLHHQ